MQSIKLKYFKLMQNLTLFFALLVSFWIPQYKFTLSLFIVIWLIVSVFQFNILNRLVENYKKDKRFFFILQIVFFLLLVVGYFLSNNKNEASDVIIKKLSFLAFPILFILSGKQFSKYKDLFLKIFILSNILASIISIIWFFITAISYNKTGNINFQAYDEFGHALYTYSWLSAFHHPAYFSMYIVFSIAAMFYFKQKTNLINSKNRTILFYFTLLFFSAMVFLLSSRAGIISLFLLFIWEIIKYIKINSSIFIKISAIVLILTSVLILSQNSRVIRTYNEISKLFSEDSGYKNYPTRLLLWESATKIISENFWTGTGTGDTKKALSEKTKKFTKYDPNITTFNAHNQFLEIFMSSGLIGFLIFISILIIGLLKAIKSKNELFILFLTIIIFNFLFESMLNTIAGIVFFVYFLNYFMFVFNNDKINNENL